MSVDITTIPNLSSDPLRYCLKSKLSLMTQLDKKHKMFKYSYLKDIITGG